MEFTIASGQQHSVALKSDGSLKSWGNDDDKQVSDTPAGNDFVFVSAYIEHSVAIKSNGRLKSWGRDFFKQFSDTPTGNDFVFVSADGDHSVALRKRYSFNEIM